MVDLNEMKKTLIWIVFRENFKFFFLQNFKSIQPDLEHSKIEN